VMSASDCGSCAFALQCPAQRDGARYVLNHTPAQRRIAARRAEQTTDAFKENYSIRAGGESVNSGLKRKTGMGRLRTRGQPRVRMAVLFRCAGWNLFRALATLKKRGIRNFKAAAASLGRIVSGFGGRQTAFKPFAVGPQPILRLFSPTPILVAA